VLHMRSLGWGGIRNDSSSHAGARVGGCPLTQQARRARRMAQGAARRGAALARRLRPPAMSPRPAGMPLPAGPLVPSLLCRHCVTVDAARRFGGAGCMLASGVRRALPTRADLAQQGARRPWSRPPLGSRSLLTRCGAQVHCLCSGGPPGGAHRRPRPRAASAGAACEAMPGLLC